MAQFTLNDLAKIIDNRSSSEANDSYTKSLLEAGIERIAKKFGEESVEAIIAAMQGDTKALVMESADVIYHLLVMLHASGITTDSVLQELQRRTAQSGLEEKAGRSAPQS